MLRKLKAGVGDFLDEILGGVTPPPPKRRSSHHHPQSHSQHQSRSHHHESRPHASGHRQEHQHKDRALTAQLTSSHDVKDFDLDLKSLWFAKSPPAFPPRSMTRDGKLTYASSSGWSSSGVRKTHTFTAHVRNTTTLAGTKIRLTWDASNPAVTVKVEQRHDPPPRQLGRSELESCRERYSDVVADWSESKMGSQVGDGECWTLAHNALVAVAAKCSSRGQEPCMTSQGLIHGYLRYSYIPSSTNPEPQGKVRDAGVARGDIIQLLKAHFKYPGGEAWAGDPDHTAIITGIEPNGVLRVVEQNVGGKKRVQTGKYDIAQLVSGEVRIFQVVGESWIGKLDPTW